MNVNVDNRRDEAVAIAEVVENLNDVSSGEAQLLRAVLVLALRDAISNKRSAYSRQARLWFRAHSTCPTSLEWMCQLLGINNVDALRGFVAYHAGSGRNVTDLLGRFRPRRPERDREQW